MRFSLSTELWHRLPRHPDWRYELIDGEALLSHRPRPLLLRRATAVPVQQTRVDAEVRALDLPADRAVVAELLVDTWSGEDPLSQPAGSRWAAALRGREEPGHGSVWGRGGGRGHRAVCAVALVHNGHPGPPTLTWLTVARGARERGLATGLLALITAELRTRGAYELASAASAANLASLRWHLTRGFELADDPLRESLRAARVEPSRRERV